MSPRAEPTGVPELPSGPEPETLAEAVQPTAGWDPGPGFHPLDRPSAVDDRSTVLAPASTGESDEPVGEPDDAIAAGSGADDEGAATHSPSDLSAPATQPAPSTRRPAELRPAEPWPERATDPRSAIRAREPERRRDGYADPMTVARFGRLTGVDLGFVPVVRSEAVGREAVERSARAYTRGGVVHLPEAAGPEDRHDTGALLGHELTHVLQQRALGALADEGGPLADLLEAEARDVELALRGERPAPDIGSWSWAGDTAAASHRTWNAEQGFSGPGTSTRPAMTGSTADTTAPVQRAPLTLEPPPPPRTNASDVDSAAQAPVSTPMSDESQPILYPAELQPKLPEAAEWIPTDGGLTEEDVARVVQAMQSTPAPPSIDLRDPLLLDTLANGLYGRMRSRLRGELIADRERAGCLTEFH